jgi:predicted Zn finger-like uncharacterized protein
MIIECPACRTRFRLDEAKIKGKGARVRCRRCGESILVLKPDETPAAFAGEAGATGMLDLRSAVGGTLDEGTVSAPSTHAASTPPEPFSTVGFDPDAHVKEESPPGASTPGIVEPLVVTATPEAAPAPGIDEVDAAFEKFLVLGPPEKESLPEAEKEDFAPGEDLAVDFRPEEKMEFALGSADEPVFDLTRKEPPAAEPPTTDFLMSDKDSLGFLREEHDKEIRRGQFDISISLRQEPQDSKAPAETPVAPPPLDFMTRDAESPPERSPEESALPPQPPTDAPVGREPFRPRPPESRAAATPLLRPPLIALALLFVALAGGGGYLGFTKNGQELLRGLVPGMESLWLQGKDKSGPQYDVRNLIGYYEPGAKAGNLFIIKGQVTNTGRFRKSGTRVHAALLDNNDRPVAEKTCYAGNVLAGETLHVAGREKIEQALSNRFGDRLVNMDVAPGKSVPFMVVFFDAPGGISAYRLEAKDGE